MSRLSEYTPWFLDEERLANAGSKIADMSNDSEPKTPTPTPTPPGLSPIETLRDLRSLCDDVRMNLQESGDMGPRRDEMMKFLGEAVKSECQGVPKPDFVAIKKAHLDKVLSDMLTYHPVDGNDSVRADTSIAESLQRQWRINYQHLYFGLDQQRLRVLQGGGGRLEGLVFDPEAPFLWMPKTYQVLSEVEENDEFPSG